MEKFTVLLADDDPEILDFLTDDLLDTYNVLQAADGQQVIEVLASTPVDLIVSDVMMPIKDGFQLCLELKKDVRYCHIPFVMLTAKTHINSKITGLEYGADAYVEKPFSPSFLQAQIASLLRNRQHVISHFNQSPAMPVQAVALGRADMRQLERLNSFILDNIAQRDLCVDRLADFMYMSRPTLYRKIKALADLSPNELINTIRLKRASELLLLGEYRIYEIAWMVGFSSSSHFTRNFQKQFGLSPKDYMDKYRVSARTGFM